MCAHKACALLVYMPPIRFVYGVIQWIRARHTKSMYLKMHIHVHVLRSLCKHVGISHIHLFGKMGFLIVHARL